MKRIAIILCCCCALLAAGRQVVLPAGSGVFAEPRPGGAMIGALPREMALEVENEVFGWLDKDHMTRRVRFYRFALSPGKSVYATPELVLRDRAKSYLTVRRYFHWVLPVLAVVLGCVGAWRLARGAKNRVGWWALEASSLRLLLAGGVVWGAGDIFLLSSDEADFFKIGRDIAQGGISGVWPRSWGTGGWYAPFIRLCGAANEYEVLPVLSVATLLLGCAAVALTALLVRRLGGSEKQSAWGAFAYAVLPMFFYRGENWAADSGWGFFAWPPTDWSFELYQNMTWSGFNAMSDTPALAMLLALLLWSLSPGKGAAKAFGLGALFGAACLLRINNIFYGPALGLAFASGADWDGKVWCKRLATGAAGFLAVFWTQFALNWSQFGSPLTFPYVLYENTARGFVRSMVPHNLPVLFGANSCVFLAGGVALLSMARGTARSVLALWVLPTLIFFTGYYHTRDDVVRFVLPVFPAFFAAGALACWNAKRALAAALTSGCALLTPLAYASWASSVLVPLWILFRESLCRVRSFRPRRTE